MPVIISFLSVLTAIFAAIAAQKASRVANDISKSQLEIQKKSFRNSILKMFFEITTIFPLEKGEKLSEHHKQLICNYFEFVCWLLENEEISEEDIKPLILVMKMKMLINFIEEKRDFNKTLWSAYWNWLKKKKIVH